MFLPIGLISLIFFGYILENASGAKRKTERGGGKGKKYKRKELPHDASLQVGVKHRPASCSLMSEHGDWLSVHYEGRRYNDGKVIDSSREREEAFTFRVGLGEVMSGWDKGLQNMCVGEKRKLTIPSDFAYGKVGAGHDVPGDATLVYDVELINILGDDEVKQEERLIGIEDQYPKS
eukprot:CAMPEP_0194354046 /NCGR_PEP_ID=MMETSP0174-20130528/2230_1 /TAXON_ID=216777 /ORGANISM="Proboscia alata, Strain PI-D3" /LENGTH=176 /DNA_ID=CAMNT_0039122803 /DNA_START=41 /DNA_END=571 /DNA_ORIENTATION=-